MLQRTLTRSSSLQFVLAAVLLVLIGTIVWGPNIAHFKGYLYVDVGHFLFSYKNNLEFFPYNYLPWVSAHRPIGRDAITLLLRVFEENHFRILGSMLAVHILNALLCWWLAFSLTRSAIKAFLASVVFLVSENAFLPVYWPAAIFDLLSTTFAIGAALAFLASFEKCRVQTIVYRSLTLLLFILAVKTKEATIVLVIPLGVLLLWRSALISQIGLFLRSRTRKAFLKVILSPEIGWLALMAALSLLLAFRIESDIKSTALAYATDYSFTTIFKSFSWYFSNYVFIDTDSTPLLTPLGSLLLLLFFTLLALTRKNFVMLFALTWWFVSLFFLAALVRQYNAPHYPYLATVGGSLFIAELAEVLSSWIKPSRVRRWVFAVLCVLTIGLNIYLSYYWVRVSTLPRWSLDMQKLSMKMYKSILKTVPNPDENSEFILVTNLYSIFDQTPRNVLQVMYRKYRLQGVLFADLEEATKHFESSTIPNRYLLVWEKDRYILAKKVRSPVVLEPDPSK